MKVALEQHDDGWYVHFGDGKSDRITLDRDDEIRISNGKKPERYLIYSPNGGILGHSKDVVGVEAKYRK